jgi:hypothetical protein
VTIIPYRPDGEKFDYAKNKPLTGEKNTLKVLFYKTNATPLPGREVTAKELFFITATTAQKQQFALP